MKFFSNNANKHLLMLIILLLMAKMVNASQIPRLDNVKAIYTNNIYYTQYLDVAVSGGVPGVEYYLSYTSPNKGIINYSLCAPSSESSSCHGVIPFSQLLVYTLADYFIVNQNGISSPKYSAYYLNNPIVTQEDLTAWNTYACGLESTTQTPPKASCRFGSLNSNKLGVADGCIPSESSIITQSLAAFYFPNKFTSGLYGLSCTAIPIADGTWVITAGHCLGSGNGFFADASNLYILPAAANLPNQLAPESIARIGLQVESEYLLKVAGDQTHCGNNCQYYADFALLKLKNARFSNPVRLLESTAPINIGDQLWIAGFGMHNVGSSGTIRNGQLNYRDEFYYGSESYGVVYSVGTMPDQQGGYSWKFDGNGDSGGPLFIYKNSQLYLVSTLTGGTYFDAANINCRFPGTQVQNASMQYWGNTIYSIINGTAAANSYIVNSK